MKPLGKALKAAFFNRDSVQEALDELLKAYRSTPHPATKIAPGDMLFRYGYQSDFHRKKPEVSGQEIDEAITRDREQKLARKQAMNESCKRREMHVTEGDRVLLKKLPKGRKFDPMYSPDVFSQGRG